MPLWLGGQGQSSGGLRGELDDVAVRDRAVGWRTLQEHAQGSGG